MFNFFDSYINKNLLRKLSNTKFSTQ